MFGYGGLLLDRHAGRPPSATCAAPTAAFSRGPLSTGQYFNPERIAQPVPSTARSWAATEMLGGGNYGVTERRGAAPLSAHPSRRFSSLARLNFEISPTTTIYAEGAVTPSQRLHSRPIGALVDTGSVLGPGTLPSASELLPACRSPLHARSAARRRQPQPGLPARPGYTTEMGPFDGFNTTQTVRGVLGHGPGLRRLEVGCLRRNRPHPRQERRADLDRGPALRGDVRGDRRQRPSPPAATPPTTPTSRP